jgi:hypothetical protein
MYHQDYTSTVTPGVQWYRRASPPLYALCVVLALLVLLVTSGPHLVHHLTELYPQDTQPSHTKDTSQLPDCLVYSLIQHTPVTEAGVALLAVFLQARGPLVVEPPLWRPIELRHPSLARAPPGTTLRQT